MEDKKIKIEMGLHEFLELLNWVQTLPDFEHLAIYKILMDKLNRIVEHDFYTKYKTAPTEQEREEARRKYIESKGIPESFRW